MSQKKPTRAYVISVYSKRALRWWRNSSPYISGDAFSDLADVSVYPPKFRGSRESLNKLSNAEVIFCPSRYLHQFLLEHKNRLSCKVLIAGNDDTEFHNPLDNLPKTIRRVYLQNSFISDDKFVFTLPIGIENFRLGVNGHPKHMKRVESQPTIDKILFGPFGNTHPERLAVSKYLLSHEGPWDLLQERLSPAVFTSIMSAYKYVGAVRGNGADTHRLWESLYRQSIPILKLDNWSNSLRRLNLPIEFVNDWNAKELKTLVHEAKSPVVNPRYLAPLWMNFWESEIKSVL